MGSSSYAGLSHFACETISSDTCSPGPVTPTNKKYFTVDISLEKKIPLTEERMSMNLLFEPTNG